MRGAPGSSMRLVDLRQLTVHQLAPLLDEEAALWRAELHWDYQFSIELIKKFLDTHSLAGVVAFEDERPGGIQGFYVVGRAQRNVGRPICFSTICANGNWRTDSGRHYSDAARLSSK